MRSSLQTLFLILSYVCSLRAANALGEPAVASLPRVAVFDEEDFFKNQGEIRYLSQDMLLKQVGQTLVDSSPFAEFYPGVAESWQFSKDRKVIVFNIRRGLRFH